MQKITFIPFLILGVFLLSGCSFPGEDSKSTPLAITDPTPAPTAEKPAAANAVTMQNFKFNPATLTVKKGETVTWTNYDSASHDVKSEKFSSELFGKGKSFSFTFNEAGTFDYVCSVHPSMAGKIIVE